MGIKRELMLKLIENEEKKMEEELKKELDNFFGKYPEIRKAVMDFLAKSPEEVYSVDEIAAVLKPTKIICETIKKIDEECEQKGHCSGCKNEKSDSCQSKHQCKPECQCNEEKKLCKLCFTFLCEYLSIMVDAEDIDIFNWKGMSFLGIHRD